MVGHEDQQPVAGDDPLPGGLEPFPQGRLPSRMQRHPCPVGVDEPGLRSEAITQAGALEEPEVGGRAVARGEIRGRVFSISRKDVYMLGRHTTGAQEVNHVLEMVKVAEIVGSRPVAAVDQEGMHRRR